MPATLKEIGGTSGVGGTFLEETFSASSAPPEHRLHQKAARAVLKALLPESGTDIKGHMKSREDLLDASGYANRSRDFDDLIRILDSEVRLITPTDPEGAQTDANPEGDDPGSLGDRCYQLTHDYLVPSLREWLTRKQRETRRGRAELRLAERAALWNAKPENRHLPALWEHLNIRLFTRRRTWSQPQRRMMRRAAKIHGLFSGLAATALLLLVVVGFAISGQIREQRKADTAESLVKSLVNADIVQVPAIVTEIERLSPIGRFSSEGATRRRPRWITREAEAVARAAFAGQESGQLLEQGVAEGRSCNSAGYPKCIGYTSRPSCP